MKVVIAEDDALLRAGLVLLLTSAGHQVAAVADSGPEMCGCRRGSATSS